MDKAQIPAQKDWVSNRLISSLVWGAPVAAIVLTGIFDVGNAMRTTVWTVANLVMGGACVRNALGCSRVHCHFTGPFFLIMSLLSFLHGQAILSLGPDGWFWIGMVILVGGLGLGFLPEWLWGRYFRSDG